MKASIPLCLVFLTFCWRPAAGAPGGQLPYLSTELGYIDNGAKGMKLTLVFNLLILPGSESTGGTATYSLTDGDAVIGTGNLEVHAGSPPPLPSVPVTYSRLASGEHFYLQFFNKAGLNAVGGAMYLNNFTKRTLTVTGGTASEGNSGTTQVPFTVAIDKAIGEPLSFSYTSSGGTATAGQDYTPVSATGTIPAGQLSTIVNVPVKGDAAAEADETLGLEITGTGASVLRGADTVATIQNDDAAEIPAPVPVLVADVASAGAMPKAWFSVNLTQARGTAITCRISTRDGTAKAGSDYQALAPTNITFAAGETQKWISITVTPAPDAAEAREEFYLDVEEVLSHTVKSAACTIEPFAITGIAPDTAEAGVYRLTFPCGAGQRCLIEESSSLTGTWNPASALLTGSSGPLEQKVHPSTSRGFFRLRAFPQVDPGIPAAGS